MTFKNASLFKSLNNKHILEEKKRAAAGVTAPACGLYLTKVVY